LIITCLWRSLCLFAEFAHQYSVVKDLKCFAELQRSSKRRKENQPQESTKDR